MIVEKRVTLTLTQKELLELVARNLRNERGINVDSMQLDLKQHDDGFSTYVNTIRIFATETSEE